MGSQKLLLPFGATTVIAHIVDQLTRSAVDEVYVVVGHEGYRIEEELAGQPLTIVTNPSYKSGMLSSVRRGLDALPERCDAAMVALGDQPSITADLVDEMIGAFDSTDKGILVPIYCGKRGHPIVFSASYREEILTHYDGVGLRGLLEAHPEDISELNVATPSVLADMDSPNDYRREVTSHEERTHEKRAKESEQNDTG